jgi:hypothetical protein
LTALISPAQGQPATVVQADSLRELLREGRPDTSRVNILLRLSNYYGRKTWNAAQNRDSALAMARQAGELSQQLKYSRGQEEAVFLEGKMLIKQEKMGAVRGLLERVSELTRIRSFWAGGFPLFGGAENQAAIGYCCILFSNSSGLK